MRRIVTFDNVSADGYFADAEGKLEWVVPDEAVFKTVASAMPDIDTMLFGRRTYEMFEKGWRHALDDSPTTAADPHDPRRRSGALREQAVWINEMAKVVFSRTLKEVTWRNSRLVPELDPAEIEAMKRGPGKDMIVFGSGALVSQLTRHALVDEYLLVVNPVFLGGGRSLLSGLPASVRLQRGEATGYASGNVVLRYTRRI